MFPRILLFIALFRLSWGIFQTIPRDAEAFKDTLKRFRRRPGSLGYFNSLYMAFTREEAKQFPDLVSKHSKMRKNKNGKLLSVSSVYNETQINRTTLEDNSLFQSAPSIKRNKETGENYKRSSSYPITTIIGDCETTIGGVNRLCTVCSAITDLGPGKIPRYINEMLCDGYEPCGVDGDVYGVCQNTAINQDFLVFQNLILKVYSQPIRVCCECSLFL